MAKIVSKGTALKADVASVLTPITQLTSIGLDGVEVETFEATTLDQTTAFKPFLPTGYTDGGSVSFEGYYDPALAAHQAIADMVATPEDQSWQIVYSDGSIQPFNGGGVGLGVTADPTDGLRWTGSIKVNGNPGFTGAGTGT